MAADLPMTVITWVRAGAEDVLADRYAARRIASLLHAQGWDTHAFFDETVFDAVPALENLLALLPAAASGEEVGPGALLSLADSLTDIADALVTIGPIEPQTLVKMAGDLVYALALEGLSLSVPTAMSVLSALGVLGWRDVDAVFDNGRELRVESQVPGVNAQQLAALISDPERTLRETIGPHLAVKGLGGVLRSMGLGPETDVGTNADDNPYVRTLLRNGPAQLDLGVAITQDGADLSVEGTLSTTVDHDPWATTVDVQGGPVTARLSPDGLQPQGAAVPGGLSVTIAQQSGAAPIRLAIPKGPGIALEGVSLVARLAMDAGGAPALTLLTEIDSLTTFLAPGAGDGFLSSMLGKDAGGVSGSVQLRFEPGKGLSFGGSAALERSFAINQTLFGGVLSVDKGRVALSPDDSGLSAELTVEGGLKLGPVETVIEGIGVALRIADSPELSFRPPSGLGLTVAAGPVKGGGYLSFAPEEGRYAGALELQIGEIGVSAVGLLLTKLPDTDGDGQPEDGFSLVLLVTSEFPPIPLGFGFNLDALGGLLGVHRTMDADALRDGLRAQSLNNIMFPKDPVARAPQILGELERAFPVRDGQHVFGPMARLSWGTPTLIAAELGLVLELDSPLRLLILGKLRLGLPSLDVPTKIAKINMDLLGLIDFDRAEASLDAVLYDSRIAAYTLEGDMAMRLRWGAHPFFALSIGGVHPAFERPPELPDLRRLAISLGAGDNPRLRLEAYVALTSNTVQFGARLDAHAAAMGFVVEGWLGFDALFELDPFRFQVALFATLALKRDGKRLLGVSLDLTLTGPSPFVASGTATASFFLLDVAVPFNATFGAAKSVSLPPGDAWTPLQNALSLAGNWRAELPEGGASLVRLHMRAEDSGAVHPMGQLGVRQQIAPLGVTLERFGASQPGALRHFRLGAVHVGAGADHITARGAQTTPLTEYFAPAQFFEMTDDEKLSSDSFVPMQAGASGFGAQGWHVPTDTSAWMSRDVFRRTVAVTQASGSGTKDRMEADVMAAAVAQHDDPTAVEPVNGFGLRDPIWAVVSTSDMRRMQATGNGAFADMPELAADGAATQPGARAALRAHLARHPEDRDALHVVALHEAEAA